MPRVDLRTLVDVDDDDDEDMSFCPTSLLEDTTTKSSDGPMILFVSGSTAKVTSKDVGMDVDVDDDDERVGVCVGDVEVEGAGGKE